MLSNPVHKAHYRCQRARRSSIIYFPTIAVVLTTLEGADSIANATGSGILPPRAKPTHLVVQRLTPIFKVSWHRNRSRPLLTLTSWSLTCVRFNLEYNCFECFFGMIVIISLYMHSLFKLSMTFGTCIWLLIRRWLYHTTPPSTMVTCRDIDRLVHHFIFGLCPASF